MSYYNSNPFRQKGDMMMPGMAAPYGMSPQNQLPIPLPTLPTGAPTGPSPVPVTAVMPTMMTPPGEIPAQTLTSVQYTPGYLRTQIGKRIKVEFLIGTNMLIDREGTLVSVGASYIIIQEVETDDLLLCDIYSIKFVRFYY